MLKQVSRWMLVIVLVLLATIPALAQDQVVTDTVAPAGKAAGEAAPAEQKPADDAVAAPAADAAAAPAADAAAPAAAAPAADAAAPVAADAAAPAGQAAPADVTSAQTGSLIPTSALYAGLLVVALLLVVGGVVMQRRSTAR